MMEQSLRVTGNPHVRHVDTTQGIMLDVLLALLPATAGGIYLFGWRAALILLIAIASAVLSEYLFCLIVKKKNPIADLSAVVTGLLLALNLPSTVPFWLPALGSAIAIVFVKQCFGGIGQNFANPAITARIILMVSFPTLMTAFAVPSQNWLSGVQTLTSATPLPYFNNPEGFSDITYSLRDVFLGTTPGCIGETSALLLLIGGIYLCIRRVISPITPLCFIGTVGLLSFLFGGDVLLSVCSGGLMLGAIYMATDYATSPTCPLGKAVFGVGCGIITVIIRRFAALPEGVSYSILLMNILVPYLNKLTPVKPFGWEAPQK